MLKMDILKKVNFTSEYALTSGLTINTMGYKYLSVLTDGEFNPDNNSVRDVAVCYDNPTACYLQWDNRDKILLNGEIKNIEIPPDAKVLKYFNAMSNPIVCVGQTISSGYGDIYFVGSNEPLDMTIPKKLPGFTWATTITHGTTKYGWIGENRFDSTHTLLIPFLPTGYNMFQALIVVENALVTSYLLAYNKFNDADYSITTLTCGVSAGFGGGNNLGINNITLYGAQRYWIQFGNADGVNDWRIQVIAHFEKRYAIT